jgi:hypothetical protein
MNLEQWAITWAIPYPALSHLRELMGQHGTHDPAQIAGESEAGVQSRIRLEASRKGCRLFRNNVGVLTDDRGVPVRYGLANDSSKTNAILKSSDLIGLRPNGQFLCREVKAAGWRYSGTPREVAQSNWINLINSLGGDAAFATGEGTL